MKISPNNWSAKHTHDNCVEIELGEDIPLERCKLKILGADRAEIETEVLTSRKFEICLTTDVPLYAELTLDNLPHSVKYIEKTGGAFYSTK